MNKDEEIRTVVAELNGLMDQLQANVAALSQVLTQPPAKESPGEEVPVL